jgi:hypothetical protein
MTGRGQRRLAAPSSRGAARCSPKARAPRLRVRCAARFYLAGVPQSSLPNQPMTSTRDRTTRQLDARRAVRIGHAGRVACGVVRRLDFADLEPRSVGSELATRQREDTGDRRPELRALTQMWPDAHALLLPPAATSLALFFSRGSARLGCMKIWVSSPATTSSDASCKTPSSRLGAGHQSASSPRARPPGLESLRQPAAAFLRSGRNPMYIAPL